MADVFDLWGFSIFGLGFDLTIQRRCLAVAQRPEPRSHIL
jgi:hypothetical protein